MGRKKQVVMTQRQLNKHVDRALPEHYVLVHVDENRHVRVYMKGLSDAAAATASWIAMRYFIDRNKGFVRKVFLRIVAAFKIVFKRRRKS
jgi:hypothetical protein